MHTKNAILNGSLNTALTLIGGLVLGIVVGDTVFRLIPGSSIDAPQLPHMLAAAVPALAGFLAGGAAWGARMAGMAGQESVKRAAWAGLLGFAPLTIALALGLISLEELIVTDLGLPIQRVFMLLFTSAAFLITTASTWALGQALENVRRPFALAWQVGLVAAAAFLLVNSAMEASGWVVGGPGAGERATMIVVLLTGILAVALTAGGYLGLRLDRLRPRA
jgi:hypothetical protein